MKKIIFALLLCLFATNVFCEEHDGRWWNSSTPSQKVHFIIGFSEAYISSLSSIAYAVSVMSNVGEEKSKEYANSRFNNYPYGYTYGEIRDFVDNFYSNPQYRTIRISLVLEYIVFPALKDAWSKAEIDSKALELIRFFK